MSYYDDLSALDADFAELEAERESADDYDNEEADDESD